MQTTRGNNFGRLLPAFLAAVVFSFAVFDLLFFVIHGDSGAAHTTEALPTVDFIRLKKDTQTQTVERRKPPPPPPPKEPPPPPKLQVQSETPPQQNPSPMDMPDLGLTTNVGGGPFVVSGSGTVDAGGGSGTGMFDGDIVAIQSVPLMMPRKAAIDGVSGYVVLDIVVATDGSVKEAKVIEAKPRGYFEAAAVSAIKRWKFKPQVVNGKPAEQHGRQRLEFKIGDE
jgi:protein TonB